MRFPLVCCRTFIRCYTLTLLTKFQHQKLIRNVLKSATHLAPSVFRMTLPGSRRGRTEHMSVHCATVISLQDSHSCDLGELLNLQHSESTGGNEDICKTERGYVSYYSTSEPLHTRTHAGSYYLVHTSSSSSHRPTMIQRHNGGLPIMLSGGEFMKWKRPRVSWNGKRRM